MKKIIFYVLSCTILTLSNNVYSQLVVKSTSGKVLVGPYTPRTSEDPYDSITLAVYGKGSYNSLGRISFGDCGRQSANGLNIVLGEYGN